MRYLIIWEHGEQLDHTGTLGRLALARPMRREWREFCYRTIRMALEEVYQGRLIASPLDPHPGPGSLIVAAYVSPRRDGVGRQENNFQLWAVGPA